jgi:hypothetical protein
VVSKQKEPEVYSITGTRASLDDDMGKRMRKYLISMSIRTACFIGAVFAAGPLRWVLVVAAVVLPYFAVVVANAGGNRVAGAEQYQPEQRALDAEPHRRIEP